MLAAQLLIQAVAVVVVVAVVAILIPGLREVLAWKDGRR